MWNLLCDRHVSTRSYIRGKTCEIESCFFASGGFLRRFLSALMFKDYLFWIVSSFWLIVSNFFTYRRLPGWYIYVRHNFSFAKFAHHSRPSVNILQPFFFSFLLAQQHLVGEGLLIHEVPRSHKTTQHSR